MDLIQIQEDILVNPQRISVVEMRRSKQGDPVVTVIVDSRSYTVTRPVKELLQELLKGGINLNKQFFAG